VGKLDKQTVVTSVKVDEALWKEAKKTAIDEGITLGELLNQAVEWRIDPKVYALIQKYLKERKT
jgi:hypothetical protein